MAYLQDYDTAKLLKEAETQLKSLGQQLAQLEVAKRQAVEDEDYDRAKMLKVRPDRQRTPEHSNRKYNVFICRRVVCHPSPARFVTKPRSRYFHFSPGTLGGGGFSSASNRRPSEPRAPHQVGRSRRAGEYCHDGVRKRCVEFPRDLRT